MPEPTSLDHVALWIAERDPLADFLCERTGMHLIERTDTFTLVGADARRGKLTLFDAEGPREPGALERVVLRVADLGAAAARIEAAVPVAREDGVATFTAPGGLRMGLVQSPGGLDYDLDHVVLRVPDPEPSSAALVDMGFERHDGSLTIADKALRLRGGGAPEGERPLLNHIALLVDSAEAVRAEAVSSGWEVVEVRDAPNTIAVFVWGPDRIKLEYVEHKPGFALV